MKTQILITILCISFTINAYEIEKSENIAKFVHAQYTGKVQGHRSGDLEGKFFKTKIQKSMRNSNTELFSTEDISSKGIQEWAGYRLTEFTIDEDSAKNPLKSFNESLSKVFEIKFRAGCEMALTPKKMVNLTFTKSVTSAQVVSIGDSVLSGMLPMIDNSLEFHNLTTEYLNDSISGYTIRYHRVFHGGIICGNASYVEVSISNRGELKQVAIKWPLLVRKDVTAPKNGADINDRIIRIEESVTMMENILNGPFSKLNRSEGTKSKETNAIHGKMNGVAFAWKKIVAENGAMILTPCYSYVSEVTYDDGHKEIPVIEIPVYSKYLKRQ